MPESHKPMKISMTKILNVWIYRGEKINVDPMIKRMVHEAMKTFPEELMKEFELQTAGARRQSDVHFSDCSNKFTFIGKELFGGNQQFSNTINGHNNNIVVVN